MCTKRLVLMAALLGLALGDVHAMRTMEFMEKFEIGQLSYGGREVKECRKPNVYARVRDPDGFVHRVARGSYLGRNYGVVTKITEDKLEISELYQGGDGNWFERKTELHKEDIYARSRAGYEGEAGVEGLNQCGADAEALQFKLLRCGSIDDRQQRLYCYDDAVGRTLP